MNEHNATEIAYKNGYAKGKIDCAREIFEELEKFVVKKVFRNGEIVYDVTDRFTELKKKYMGEYTRNN